MTVKFRIILIFSCLTFALMACSQGSESTELPELPTSALDAQNTADAANVPDDSTATPIPTNTRGARSTLPPSYTPTLTLTLTPTLTSTMIPATNVNTVAEACRSFGPDFGISTSTFMIGQSPVIGWTAVDGAGLYRIYVFDEFENQLFVDAPLVTETSYTIPAETFTRAGRYGWEVEPLDGAGIQMCLGRGELLIAN